MSDCNIENRTIFCDDNIDTLPGINSACIDLIYLDPPFNKNKKFTAPIGSSAEGASFKDIFREDDLKDEWLLTIAEDEPDLFHYLNGIKGIGKPYNFAYLSYMAIRLIECRRILKRSGSVYLHCDPTMSHYLKTTMDCIFGEKNFRNEVIWCYREAINSSKRWNRKHDTLLFYSMSEKWTFNADEVLQPHSEATVKKYHLEDEKGKYRLMGRGITGSPIKSKRDVAQNWETNHPEWVYRQYLRKGTYPVDYWFIDVINQNAKERVGYPTQKPLALLERIISASSNEGDTILDPFCGCATTCVAAERLGRKWIGIDISVKAYELVRERLGKETASILTEDVVVDLKTDPPKRTDQARDYREQKYVYVISHPHYPGEYKVGIARNWKSRLNAYQTSDPDRQYKLEYKLETPWFRETEKHIHDTFPNKHEWVQGKLDEITEAIRTHKPTCADRSAGFIHKSQ